MNPPSQKPVVLPTEKEESRTPNLRSVVHKSALLNIVIVLTSCPILIFEGGPKAVVVTLEIMTGITILIWAATLALFSLVTLPRIFRTPVSRLKRSVTLNPASEMGVADRWFDRPV